MNCPPFMKGISVFFLLTCLCAQSFRTNSVKAQESSPTEDADKVSLDLRALARREKAGARVKVIIQSKDVPGESLDSLLLAHGGHISRRLQNFNSSVAELPARAVEALANRKEIRFVSLDRETLPLGHVSMTTGADAVLPDPRLPEDLRVQLLQALERDVRRRLRDDQDPLTVLRRGYPNCLALVRVLSLTSSDMAHTSPQ